MWNLVGLGSQVKALLDRLTSTRAGYLDRLDATISSRASASNWTAALASQLSAVDGISLRSKTYMADGSFVVPTGVTLLFVSGCGGGGSGATDGTSAGGGGGAGGGRRVPIPVTAGETLTVDIGAGGAGVTGANSDGNDGNPSEITNSSSRKLISFPGGSGGLSNGSGGAGGWSTATTFDAASMLIQGGDGGNVSSAGHSVVWNYKGTGATNGGGGGASIFGDGGNAASSGSGEVMTEAAHGYGGGSGGVSSSGTSRDARSGFLTIEWAGVPYGS